MKKNRSLPTLLGYALAFSALAVISPTVEYEIGADGVSSDISIFSQMQAAEMRARARSAGRASRAGRASSARAGAALRGGNRKAVSRDINRRVDKRVDVRKNVNIKRDVDIDIHHHGHGHGHGHHHHHGPSAGAVAAGVVAGMAIGALISSLPKGCSNLVVQGVTYYNCSGTYYKPAPNGYVVVAPPQQ